MPVVSPMPAHCAVFLEDNPALKALGGAGYLVDLAASVITAINDRDYAQHIHELATRRRLLTFCNEVRSFAYDQDAPPSSGEYLINRAETRLYNLAERRGHEGAVNMPTAWQETITRIDEAMRRDGSITGVSSGIGRLDQMLGGFQPGFVYTIAGRPSMGKTAIGLTLAVNAAISGARVVFHSLEMDRTDIVARMIARLTGIPANRQRAQVSMEEFNKIYQVQVQGEISQWPLYIDDGSRLKLSQIRSRAIRQKRRFGLDMLVIDYLGLMAPADQNMNRNYQIEEITTGLKALAKELKIPVLLLAQLNRQVELRDDKRPTLADRRDSGAVEQDSDVVMFIYRHEYYLLRAEPHRMVSESDDKFNERYRRWSAAVEKARGRGELIIAKHRQGETGIVPLQYQAWRCHFFDENETAP
ncbi:MAG: AAA family ATPase [Pseudomonadota bacterium]|nr:AAA family ATPase [Pseudomonadota bacterium]